MKGIAGTQTRGLQQQSELTVIDGIDGNDIDIVDLAKTLKSRCAAGGTCKDGRIELQGDHKKKVKLVLEEMGFRTEVR